MNKRYVLGFAFDRYDNILLIQKTRPDWQSGLLNGAGGHIEPSDASEVSAMVREFLEETGLATHKKDWRPVIKMNESGVWQVKVFTAKFENLDFSDLDGKNTDTDETIRIVHYMDVFKDQRLISNVPWLIGMCLDKTMPLKNTISYDHR
jgi:8-oxo-dGTP diphosphatase